MVEIKERRENMSEKNYNVCLIVPLGVRKGTMIFHETDGKVDGWLSVMNENNRFSGMLSKDGQLTLTGMIRTLISTMHYTATGTISGQKILLNLKMDSGAYYPLSGEEFNIENKVL